MKDKKTSLKKKMTDEFFQTNDDISKSNYEKHLLNNSCTRIESENDDLRKKVKKDLS